MPKSTIKRAIKTIREELEWWEPKLIEEGKLVEAQRLHQRTMYDLEMIKEMGFCRGIENYSRHLTGKPPGAPPPTLLDYLPENSMVVIDESHQTVPQIRGMFNGDQSRKRTLVEYGFRLPSAMDNRPLNFEEFEARIGQTIYVSATPGPYELTQHRRRGRRADHPPDGSDRPGRRGASRQGSDRRPARRVSRTRRTQRARSRHHADEEDVRGSDRVLRRGRRPRPLPPLRHRDAGAHQDPARPAPRRVRRARRHQPPARRA